MSYTLLYFFLWDVSQITYFSYNTLHARLMQLHTTVMKLQFFNIIKIKVMSKNVFPPAELYNCVVRKPTIKCSQKWFFLSPPPLVLYRFDVRKPKKKASLTFFFFLLKVLFLEKYSINLHYILRTFRAIKVKKWF